MMNQLYHESGQNASGNCDRPECSFGGPPLDYTTPYHLATVKLSLKAKGLLSLMLARLPWWDFTIEGLVQMNTDGRDSVRQALNELIDAGYVERIRLKDERGRYTGNHYVIYPDGKPKGGEA